VALARALAMDPRVIALDEPLAALDAEARGEVRRLLAEHLRQLERPVLFVTHDPVEAATLTDRLVVLEEGSVTQTGTVQEVTRQPKSSWVARLVGLNLYRGRGDGERFWVGEVPVTVSTSVQGPAWATVRPQAVALHRSQPSGSPRNTWPGRVRRLEAAQGRVRVEVEAALPLVAEVTPAAVADLGLVEGMQVWVAFKATEVEVYPD
jgi:molybdate transport system ATP-binding protein